MKIVFTLMFTISFSCFLFGQNNLTTKQETKKTLAPAFKFYHFSKNEKSLDTLTVPKLFSNNKNREETTNYNMPIINLTSEDKMPILEPTKEQKYSLRIIPSK